MDVATPLDRRRGRVGVAEGVRRCGEVWASMGAGADAEIGPGDVGL